MLQRKQNLTTCGENLTEPMIFILPSIKFVYLNGALSALISRIWVWTKGLVFIDPSLISSFHITNVIKEVCGK